ncbi:MAG TPA: TonB family protein [Bryobacteraceae bacterium]|nr:TonB family protein [Bryobacteraceae bacterium]
MAQAITVSEPGELNLLREWREPLTTRRILRDGLGSMCVHAAALTILIVLGGGPPPVRNAPGLTVDFRKSIPLYLPRELTQKDPNRGKITKQLDVRSARPPAPVPQAPRFRPPPPAPGPVAAVPAPVIEPPKIEASATPPPPIPAGRIPQEPPPPEKPKLAFEPVGARGPSPIPNPDNIKLPDPKTSAEQALRASIQPSPQGGGIVIGDIDEFNAIPNPNQPPAGPVRSNLQLLSDPKGVDFKPYLIQILAAVRTNWLAVIPESARLGMRGRVLVQFIIDRRGGVPKLVIAESSGTTAFDRAAVAGISASNPFPPLPANFQGPEIRLQLAFSYNLPAR